MPTDAPDLGQTPRRCSRDNAWEQIKPINQGDYDTVPSVIPKRLGGRSPIKHIVVIIKENRTYDQVLGDLRARATVATATGGRAVRRAR